MPGYHPGNSYNIVTAPIDSRPISKEYLRYLVSMGGDSFFCVDEAYLDEGPSISKDDFVFGNPSGVQSNLASLVSSRNLTSTIVILNTTSYVNGGLVGARMPDRYEGIASALSALDSLTINYSNPIYYVHAPMPRTIPDTRFPWHTDYSYGLNHYSGKKPGEKTAFVELLREWAYTVDKQFSGYGLETWELKFKNEFEQKYKTAPDAPRHTDGKTYPALFQQIFQKATQLINELIDRVALLQINELIVGIDDINLPTFYINNSDLVTYDTNGNLIKFSFTRMYLNLVKAHHVEKYDVSSRALGEIGNSTIINYISGVDEVPQLIYARDLARRTGFATNFKPNYNFDKNPSFSESHVPTHDYMTAKQLITQRIYFVTKRGYNAPSAREFHLFVHNWGSSGTLKANDFEMKAGVIEPAAIKFAEEVYKMFDANKNVGVLDLATNIIDWELYSALGSIPGHQRTQLVCYSGWNTAGNATGLGIAHAQVFGMLDYYNATKGMWSWHANLLAQHLLEDGIYNTTVKPYPPHSGYLEYLPDTSYRSVATNTWGRLRGDNPDNPSGFTYVLRYLTDSRFPMRLAGTNYTWASAYVKPNTTTATDAELRNVTGHPWNRTFECIVDTYIW